jgi:predicted dehydrogenase
MDNYTVIWEFPDNLRFSWSHMYFDPPGFSGVKMRVFGSKGAIDLETATWMEREGKGAKKLPPESPVQEPSWARAGYLSLAAFIDNVRNRKTPLNNADSARISTLTHLLHFAAQSVRNLLMPHEAMPSSAKS